MCPFPLDASSIVPVRPGPASFPGAPPETSYPYRRSLLRALAAAALTGLPDLARHKANPSG